MTVALRWKLFLTTALGINLLVFATHSLQAIHKPMAYGLAFDIGVTVPLLYFFLVVRAGVQPAITLVPLCLLALLRVTYVAPDLAVARPAVGACAEIAVLWLLVSRTRRGLRAAGSGDGDMLERLRLPAREIVPVPFAADVLATEIAVLYYAFGSWRKGPRTPTGTLAFSIHEQTTTAMLFAVAAGMSLMEAAIVHALVMRWSHFAAWILTALSVYAAVWLVAVSRAFRLRPLLVDGTHLMIRNGLLHSLRVPLSAIAEVRRSGFDDAQLNVPPASDPNVALVFSAPMTVEGMYGTTRSVTRIALAVDDPAAFLAAL